MSWFEVYIPGKVAGAHNVTLTVEAQNWIGALKTGLSNIGEGHEAISNVMCDIKEDNSIHVTDVATRRVFRLREVATPAAAPQVPVEARTTQPMHQPPIAARAPAPSAPPPALSAPPPSPWAPPAAPITQPNPVSYAPRAALESTAPMPPSSGAPAPVAARPAAPPQVSAPPVEITEPVERKRPASKTAASTTASKTASSSKLPQSRADARPAPPPQRDSGQFTLAPQPHARQETRHDPHTDPRIGRHGEAPTADFAEKVQDAIADVFDATQDLLLATKLKKSEIAEKLLDIALQHAPAEAGTFYLADVNGHELAFTAVRGPKADAIRKSGLTVPVGQGIVGFCAQEGLCLSISDIQHDPRYFSAVADAIGYQPRDTLCASAEKDGRLFGAVQLINSKSGFDAVQMEVLRYIGLTAAALLERVESQSA